MKTRVKFLIALLFCLFTCEINSQGTDSIGHRRIAPWVYISFDGSFNIHGTVLPSSGFQIGLGFNAARLFEKNFVLGFCGNFQGWMLGTNKGYSSMSADVFQYLILDQDNPGDSIRAMFLFSAFNHDENRNFLGGGMTTVGLIYSPFPDRFGGLMIQVKRGFYFFPINGAYGVPYLNNNNEDYEHVEMHVPVTWSAQLTCKPLRFWKGKYHPEFNPADFFHVSFYYESISLRRGKMDGTPLTKFFQPEFFNKYGTDTHFGIKISFGYY